MTDKNNAYLPIQLALSAGVPFLLSLLAVIFDFFLLFIPAAIVLFASVAIFPVYRKRENLWMFVLAAPMLLTADIRFAPVVSGEFLAYEYRICNILAVVLVALVMFCIEETALAVITRSIWRRQYRMISF